MKVICKDNYLIRFINYFYFSKIKIFIENSKIMKEAYASLKGKWGLAIGGNLLVGLIVVAVALVGWRIAGQDWGANLTSLIFSPPLAIGMTIFFL